jgi:hypothetical protein
VICPVRASMRPIIALRLPVYHALPSRSTFTVCGFVPGSSSMRVKRPDAASSFAT